MTMPRISRGPVGYISAILAGCASAALFAVALTHAQSLLLFMLSYLTAVPLFIVGLGAGSIAGLLASLMGTLGLFLTTASNFAFDYAFIFAIPTTILIAMALRFKKATGKVMWFKEGHLLTFIAIYPCLIFLGFCGLTYGHPGGLQAITLDAFNEIADQLSKQMSGEQATMLRTMMDRIANIAPALIGSTWLLLTVIGMAIAQSILQQNKLNLREAFTLRGLDVPNWLIYAVAVTGLVGVMAPAPFDYIGKNMSIILGSSFFFVGLAVIHAYAATLRWPRLFIWGFYIILSLLVWLVLLVALVGVLDQWIGFRQRLKKTKTPS